MWTSARQRRQRRFVKSAAWKVLGGVRCRNGYGVVNWSGLTRDPQFGPCVMFARAASSILRDVAFAARLEVRDAKEMMQEIKGRKILDAVRGMEAADQKMLVDMLISVGRVGLDFDDIMEIDLNPVILSGSKPVVVDALMVLK